WLIFSAEPLTRLLTRHYSLAVSGCKFCKPSVDNSCWIIPLLMILYSSRLPYSYSKGGWQIINYSIIYLIVFMYLSNARRLIGNLYVNSFSLLHMVWRWI